MAPSSCQTSIRRRVQILVPVLRMNFARHDTDSAVAPPCDDGRRRISLRHEWRAQTLVAARRPLEWRRWIEIMYRFLRRVLAEKCGEGRCRVGRIAAAAFAATG